MQFAVLTLVLVGMCAGATLRERATTKCIDMIYGDPNVIRPCLADDVCTAAAYATRDSMIIYHVPTNMVPLFAKVAVVADCISGVKGRLFGTEHPVAMRGCNVTENCAPHQHCEYHRDNAGRYMVGELAWPGLCRADAAYVWE